MSGISTKKKGMLGQRRFWPHDPQKQKSLLSAMCILKRLFLNSLSPSLYNPILKLLARFETGNAARFNVDLRARLRVAADAAFSFGGIKCAKAGQSDLVIFAKTLCHVVRRCVEYFFRQSFGAFAVLGNVGNEFCFCHDSHPLKAI